MNTSTPAPSTKAPAPTASAPTSNDIVNSRRMAVHGLTRQGVTDPKQVTQMLNFHEDGTPTGGGFTDSEVRAHQKVNEATVKAHQQIYGRPGVDEGTATMANRIENGENVAKVKSEYTRVGNKNFPKNKVGNASAAAYRRSVGSEADAGDMSGYDPNLGRGKK